MAQVLWNIVISPLVYLIELVFSLFWYGTGSPGVAIIGVSIVVNLLCLPLYKMADDAQERERAKQASMQRWVDHIRATFTGDERYMMLSAYYAEQGYRPVQALVSSLSLLLQIPFFISAYSFLSNLKLLQGTSFLFLSDLGSPDGLIRLGGLTLNLLPIVMTALNCVSTAVYTRGLPLRDKIQAYGLAAVFLVLLYDSPSGLVFYWTCNQLFSLGKNLVMKTLARRRAEREERKQTQTATVQPGRWKQRLRAVEQAVRTFARPWKGYRPSRRRVVGEFLMAALLLTCLIGVLIPSSVIGDSPTEFVDLQNIDVSPISHIVHTACVWGGLFVLWVGIYFFLSNGRGRSLMAATLFGLCGACLLNHFVFGLGQGTISSELVYDNNLGYDVLMFWVSSIVIVLAFCLLHLLWFKLNRMVLPALTTITAALLVVAIPNIVNISRAYGQLYAEVQSNGTLLDPTEYASYSAGDHVGEAPGSRPTISSDPNDPLLQLSTTERNVVIIFLDRALSGYVPFIMNERPELEKAFDGFTYYPNTISFGTATNFGAPPIYGGYEYTPAAMNANTTKTIPEKHNDALLLLPTLFSNAGSATTVVDPPYAGNYRWYPDLSIYSNLANTRAFYNDGSLLDDVLDNYHMSMTVDINRQFVCYGFFRVLPQVFQILYYDDGRYLSTADMGAPPHEFMVQYSVLLRLSELSAANPGPGAFVQLANTSTHQPTFLQLPDYLPAEHVDNKGLEDMSRFTLSDGRTVKMDTREQLQHYHVNIGALLRLGEWFDWMRENGVYDNTRIIIVSDHGRWLYQFEGQRIDKKLDVQMVNPLFMVKDFDAHGFTTSDEFMTNADAAVMAAAGVIENPTNPFTGVALSSAEKTAHEQYVTASHNWVTSQNDDVTFDTSDAPWYAVSNNIFDLGNWRRLDADETAEVSGREGGFIFDLGQGDSKPNEARGVEH